MHFDFNWEKDRKTLHSEGRRYLFNLEKNYQFVCDQCGMLIRKEVEVGRIFGIPEKYTLHLEKHTRNRELFEQQKVSRGWLKRHREWVEEGEQKVVLETKERVGKKRRDEAKEPSARVMYDSNYLRCGLCGELLEIENVNDGVENGLL